MVDFHIEANLPTIDEQVLKALTQRKVKELWKKGLKFFFNKLLDGMPSISGATAESLDALASKYGARYKLAENATYEIWENWNYNDWQPPAEETWSLAFRGALCSWKLEIPAEPFRYNEFGANYVRYWLQEGDDAYYGWASGPAVSSNGRTKGILYSQRVSGDENGEPWNRLLRAKEVLTAYLRREYPRILKASLRGSLKGGRSKGVKGD